jgi:MFS family permease
VYVLGVLLMVHILNFVDRNILAIVAGDIKAEMALSDTELGILLGPAFATFFSLAGIPIARLADMTSRRNVIAVGLVLWSAMTAASGSRSPSGTSRSRASASRWARRHARRRRTRSSRRSSSRGAAPPRSRSTASASTSA